MQRREALAVIGLGGAGYIGTAAFTAPGCPGAKNLSTYVLIITRSYGEIEELLPELGLGQTVITKVSGFIAKAVTVAKDFDKAYRAGAFENAANFFNSLTTLSSQIAGELFPTSKNRLVKAALAGIGIARIAIAALLQAQIDNLPAARTAKKSPAIQQAEFEVQRLNRIDLANVMVL